MYEQPVLFPQISNRETFFQIIQIADDDTGDLIALTDTNNNALYNITLQIMPPRMSRGGSNCGYGSYYDVGFEPLISVSLADYISIVDTGTIQIQIPPTVVSTLRGETYDVFLLLSTLAGDDARQLLIGRLPVLYGGSVSNTASLNQSGGKYGLP